MSKGPAAVSSSSGATAATPAPIATGSVSPASALHAQPEKPQHYTYLKEFRTEQCPLFVQHKCSQHRPFTCFYWHFVNQRRRRPIRRRDGTFNYSPDIYCTQYEEGSGTCPDGDDCPFLHRTAGDTERRYHLRYYKTGTCIHETDGKGNCSKNGPHCTFAHGPQDLRTPVYDIRELQAMEAVQNGPAAAEGSTEGQPAIAASYALIEKILCEEPRWQETSYVLSSYKTEQCKKPPRLCRQGYACPYYHNSKDRRRGPRKHKYRSLPCPGVKHADEWGDPSKCENGDGCQYCHTRTEQQFHPEIYKSTKCNDMQQAGSCPRGPFCAFAHMDQPLCSDEAQSSCSASSPTLAGLPLFTPADSLPVSPTSPHTTELHSILSSSCSSPNPSSICVSPQRMLGRMLSQESSNLDAPFFTTVGGGYGKAPGFEREDQAKQKAHTLEHRSGDPAPFHCSTGPTPVRHALDGLGLLPVGSPPMSSISSSMTSSLATTPPSPAASSNTRGMNANALPFYPTSDTVESVVESALDDLDLNDFGMAALEKSFDSTTAARSSIMIGGSLLQSSAPVNIPGSLGSSASFHSASPSPPINSSHFMPSSLQQHQRHLSQSDGTFPQGSLGLNGMNSSIWEHFPPGNFSPSSSPAFLTGASPGELTRLRHELDEASRALKQWEESWRQARQACDMWKREAEEANEDAASAGREVAVAVKRREVLEQRAQQLQEELQWLQAGKEPQILHCYEQLQLLPLPTLYNLQTQLRSGLERVEQPRNQDERTLLETIWDTFLHRECTRTLIQAPAHSFHVGGPHTAYNTNTNTNS
ncbi:RING finger protein unkempt homolog isoform X2 [Acipenser ruthenus]|uniref:RING finger protein unkempt homolog isoform X2 n=1 Tax=Acipenser ruthenus TaxID=7906 RepID=UPI00274084B3|nr:RING finger protein unkempt homolog isoform X2 [Acipenser ruthenus]